MKIADRIRELDEQGRSPAEIARETGASLARIQEVLDEGVPRASAAAPSAPPASAARAGWTVIPGVLIRSTQRAFLVKGPGGSTWIPRSVSEIRGDGIAVKDWFAEKELGLCKAPAVDYAAITRDLLA